MEPSIPFHTSVDVTVQESGIVDIRNEAVVDETVEN
jgi:hypothetical protein